MRASIPFHVGHDSVGCGPAFHSMWAGIPVMRGSRGYPRVAASRSSLTSSLPLLFHPCHLRSERLPVAFWDRRFLHFLDDVGEVLQAGDWCTYPGVEHGDILAGASQQDGSRDLLEGDATAVHFERQFFIGN